MHSRYTSKLLALVESAISKLNIQDKHFIRREISKILLKKNVSVSPDYNSELSMFKSYQKIFQ